ncbi:nuclear transport factor 2 family protein [Blastococcus sp. URHD0036]|uniref:nuclear transport factor 2 family protein n=1 Tax=Blastococcus sp. URHD0036 TaxID=1380356 RepID=UPI000495B04B|nr:nuclear transport factor 2 family protein [Blastococcus sp. URHD0036]
MELWELVARERIRDTLAHYNWSGDAGRAEELSAAFTPDGVLQVRGGAAHRGRAAIRDFIGGVAGREAAGSSSGGPVGPKLVRHVLTNTRFRALSPEEATAESYFTVVTEIGLDHAGRYRDTLVPVGERWLIASRLVSTDWVVAGSVMASPSPAG